MRETFLKKNLTNENNSTEKASEVFVGEWDRAILESGTKGVILQMLKDFDGLPDAIVLPETSARPLFYVLRPVFQKLQESRGEQMPKFYFFNTKTPSATLSIQERSKGNYEDDSVTIDSIEELRASIEEMEYPAELTERLLKGEAPEKMKEARDLMKERATEILERAPNARIAVVDEYESNGGTAREVRRAFSSPDLRVYSIFSGYGGGDATQTGTAINIDREGNPRRNNRAKLTYSGESAVGVQKDKQKVFEKYSTVIRNHPDLKYLAELKARLRKELTAVGEVVANSIPEEMLDKKAA